jgi:hypothetical protein
VNGEKLMASGEAVISEYTNGTEVVAMFDDNLIPILQRSAKVSISIGSGQPIFQVRSLNSIAPNIEKFIGSVPDNGSLLY